MGVAGAAAEPNSIVLTGVAGLLAGAFSMAAGEFISMLSQREMFEHQIVARARRAPALPGEEEAGARAHLAGPRHPTGRSPRCRHALIANPEKALDTLAREELGLNPGELGSPVGAAGSSFVAFAVGASLPLIPFLLGTANGVAIAAAISGAALFVVGALLSLFSGKNAWLSGLRMLAIGAAAARCDLRHRIAVQRLHLLRERHQTPKIRDGLSA